MSLKEIVFDIETQNAPMDEINFRDLKISVVGAYFYETDEFRAFREENLNELWPLFERADRIIGFNSEHFDIPVLHNYYTGDLSKIAHLDILKEVKRVLGFRIKLDDLAKATLNTQKSAHGLQAIEWFKAGEWEKIEKYCLDDVRITRDLYEFGKKNKQLFYPDATGVKPFPVRFNAPPVEKGATPVSIGLNLTLPF